LLYAQVLAYSLRLRGERFVQLEKVGIYNAQPCPLDR